MRPIELKCPSCGEDWMRHESTIEVCRKLQITRAALEKIHAITIHTEATEELVAHIAFQALHTTKSQRP